MNVIQTVGILVVKDNKVLLVKHGESASHITGVYGWPGGRLEEGESMQTAAVRELAEETGLQATEKSLELFSHNPAPVSIKRKNGEYQTFSVDLFVCKRYTGHLKSSGETIPEWVSVDDLGSLPLLPNVQLVYEQVVKQNYL